MCHLCEICKLHPKTIMLYSVFKISENSCYILIYYISTIIVVKYILVTIYTSYLHLYSIYVLG